MKKMKANVNMNDRITIQIIEGNTIQYMYVEAKTGKEYSLGDPINFSLSVKKYFGCEGKTIRQLYAFDDWHNKKLQNEMNRIWRYIDGRSQEKKPKKLKQQKQMVCRNDEDERAA